MRCLHRLIPKCPDCCSLGCAVASDCSCLGQHHMQNANMLRVASVLSTAAAGDDEHLILPTLYCNQHMRRRQDSLEALRLQPHKQNLQEVMSRP